MNGWGVDDGLWGRMTTGGMDNVFHLGFNSVIIYRCFYIPTTPTSTSEIFIPTIPIQIFCKVRIKSFTYIQKSDTIGKDLDRERKENVWTK